VFNGGDIRKKRDRIIKYIRFNKISIFDEYKTVI
jgi:hypothetical protein